MVLKAILSLSLHDDMFSTLAAWLVLHVQIFQVQWFSIKNLLCTPERSYEDGFDVFIKSFLCINWDVCPSTSLEADVDSIYFLALQRFFFGVVLDDSPALAYAFCL